MFWGLIMEPGRCYTQKVKVPFHISMASMDISNSSDDPAQVMCVYENRNYLLCTLNKRNQVQVNLDLNFSANTKVSFATNGNSHIHLTGFLNVDDEEEEVDEEEAEEDESEVEASDVEDEAVEQLRKGTLKRLKANNKGPSPKKMKSSSSGTTTNLITKSPVSKTLAAALNGEDLDDEENDSDFVLDQQESEDEFNSDGDDAGENDDEIGSDVSDLSSDDDVDTDEDDDDDDDDPTDTEEETDDEEDQENGIAEAKSSSPKKHDTSAKAKLKQQQQQQQQQQKKKAENGKSPKSDDSVNKSKTKKGSAKQMKKMLKGGVFVEDLKEGHGKQAGEGKVVSVYYEGRFKEGGKIFDSSKQGKGFSWRIGSKSVIKGLDVGVKGMKVGGQRRITIPANLAYGARGEPPTIPPNAPLVFWVELKNCK